MSADRTASVVRTVYVDSALDMRIKRIAFTRKMSMSDLINELIASGLLAYDATGERSIADDMDERHRLKIKYREEKIAELVGEVDGIFDERWERILIALRKAKEEA